MSSCGISFRPNLESSQVKHLSNGKVKTGWKLFATNMSTQQTINAVMAPRTPHCMLFFRLIMILAFVCGRAVCERR